jgi:hypothetical protein
MDFKKSLLTEEDRLEPTRREVFIGNGISPTAVYAAAAARAISSSRPSSIARTILTPSIDAARRALEEDYLEHGFFDLIGPDLLSVVARHVFYRPPSADPALPADDDGEK